MKLRNEQGILAMPPIQKKEKITEATVQAAIAMFMDNEYSRQMPGQKRFYDYQQSQTPKKVATLQT